MTVHLPQKCLRDFRENPEHCREKSLEYMEDRNMPGMNGKGPLGNGPLTGGMRGVCNQTERDKADQTQSQPATVNAFPGPGKGLGRCRGGAGKGQGRGQGRGGNR